MVAGSHFPVDAGARVARPGDAFRQLGHRARRRAARRVRAAEPLHAAERAVRGAAARRRRDRAAGRHAAGPGRIARRARQARAGCPRPGAARRGRVAGIARLPVRLAARRPRGAADSRDQHRPRHAAAVRRAGASACARRRLHPPGYVAEIVGRRQRLNVAATQVRAYPDIQPAWLEGVPPSQAFAPAAGVAQALGWRIVASVPGGRIEATDTSRSSASRTTS